jgi:hypothetical protein
MNQAPGLAPHAVAATLILHQEGVIAVIALIGLALRDEGVAAGLAARGTLAAALLEGCGVAVAAFVLLWLARTLLAPLRELETWQRGMVAGWSAADVAAVAVFSGVAEEALVRAVLQPALGLLPAAAIFALLHVVPDRRLWLWPVIALGLGVVLGWLFARSGYPAAATAHVVLNALSLTRLRLGAAA